ncbi:MAG: subclass B1 metallo-beta-lactamase [Litorimonas sp.]
MPKNLCLTLTAFTTAFTLTGCGDKSASVPSHNSFIDQLKKDYPVSLAKIADNVWVHTTNYTFPGQTPVSSNGLVVASNDDLILVDTSWGEMATLSLLESIKDQTGREVTKLIITQHHMNRIAGVDVAERKGIKVFTHPETPKLAVQNGYPVPNTSVSSLKLPKSRTRVGPVEVAYPGHGQTLDNLVVYVPSANILYGGCAIRSAGSTNLGNIADANLKTWGPALAWVKTTYPETKTVVPCRGKGANLSLIDDTLALIAKRVNAQQTQAVETDDTPAKP